MNKIILVEDKNIRDGEYSLEINKDVTLNIEGLVIGHDLHNNNEELNIEISNDSSLELYQVKDTKEAYKLNITIQNNAKLYLNMLVRNKGCNQIIININMVANNSEADINIRGINRDNNSNLDIICNGYIKENTKENCLIENLKGFINNNDSIKISPNMYIKTNDVSANHLVTIRSFSNEELFYLESLGLSENKAKELLLNSFLKQGFRQVELDFLNLGGEENA